MRFILYLFFYFFFTVFKVKLIFKLNLIFCMGLQVALNISIALKAFLLNPDFRMHHFSLAICDPSVRSSAPEWTSACTATARARESVLKS